MNQKQFEIWKIQKEKEFEAELNNLQEDFARRGLTFSGMRNKAEKDLREKYDSEIEITRLDIERVTNRTPLYTSWWMIYIVYPILILVVGVIFNLVLTSKQTSLSERPFLDFGSDKISAIWVTNVSNYPAINPQFFLKRDNIWFISNLKLASAISPGQRISVFKLDGGVYDRSDSSLTPADGIFLANHFQAKRIIDNLNNDQTFTSGVLVIYEDLSGNVYFTSSGNSESKSLKTGSTGK